MTAVVYNRTDIGKPAFRVQPHGTGPFAVILLNNDGLKIQSSEVEELADLAAVITKAAVELGNAQRAAQAGGQR